MVTISDKKINRWRWVSPYEDPCKCIKIQFSGMNVDTPKNNRLIRSVLHHYGLQCTGW